MALRTVAVHCKAEARSLCETDNGGPGLSSPAYAACAGAAVARQSTSTTAAMRLARAVSIRGPGKAGMVNDSAGVCEGEPPYSFERP